MSIYIYISTCRKPEKLFFWRKKNSWGKLTNFELPTHFICFKKKLDGVMYIFLQGFDGDFFIVYFLQGLAVKIKRSLQG